MPHSHYDVGRGRNLVIFAGVNMREVKEGKVYPCRQVVESGVVQVSSTNSYCRGNDIFLMFPILRKVVQGKKKLAYGMKVLD